jgi:hypothetical protein
MYGYVLLMRSLSSRRTTEVHYTASFETFPDVENVNEDHPEKAQLSQQLISTSNECTSRPSTFNFKSSRSSNYFRNHAHNSNGPSYLVSNAIFGSVHDTGRIDHREVVYHILITLFLLSLTTNQQEMFASIMEFVIALTEKAVHQRLLKMPVPLHQTSPPSSMKDFRNRYLRDPQSIVSNLACPKIQFIHGHGYVSVRDCISNLLAHGRPINAFFSGMKIPSEDMLVGTSVSTTAGCFMLRKMLHRAQEKYTNENVLCLPLYEWGDDYDPLASIKGGRASCHCKSIAIAPPHGKHNSLDNTFILALSRKKQNHEPMEALFCDEMLSLQDTLSENWFYWKEVGKNVKVYAELFASLQDKPERCGSMFLTLGSGAFSPNWRHSCN